MHDPEHQKQVLEALKQVLKKDRTKTTVVGMTGLGLIEMTRKKVRKAWSQWCFRIVLIVKEGENTFARVCGKKCWERDKQILYKNNSKCYHGWGSSYCGRGVERRRQRQPCKNSESVNKKVIIKPSAEVGHEEVKIKEVDIDTLVWYNISVAARLRFGKCKQQFALLLLPFAGETG